MGIFNMKRVAVFIDGNNFYFGLRKLFGKNKSLKNFDFAKFAQFLAGKEKVTAIYYYNALLDKEHNSKKYESQKEFFEKLKQIPNFHLVLCKLLKRSITGTNKFYYIIKEDDINMAVDMVENACDNNFDIAILVSGDGDFVPAVRSVKKKNKLVKNVYFKNSSSRNLKNFCDESLELTKQTLEELFYS
ncbi:NYN domain-containing protein [Candidatus Pacearchaeota archaeon]|nr:NYN domain-containing protein [Candidatus Pacearchaeota archaeon]